MQESEPEFKFELLKRDLSEEKKKLQDKPLSFYYYVNNFTQGQVSNSPKPLNGLWVCEFNSVLYMGYAGTGEGQHFDGTTWSSGVAIPNLGIYDPPCLIVFNSKLYCIHTGANGNTVWYTTTTDGKTWSTDTQIGICDGISYAPTAVVYDNILYVAYKYQGSGIRYVNSRDGVNWEGAYTVSGQSTNGIPFIHAYNGILYMAFRPNDGHHPILVIRSTNGGNGWSSPYYSQLNGAVGPSAINVQGAMYIVGRGIEVQKTTDGTDWSEGVYILNDGTLNDYAVSNVVFNGHWYMYYQNESGGTVCYMKSS